MIEITEITIFPIKSCKGIGVGSALVEPRGLQFDRRFMLVDSNARFVTQRQHPKMSQITLAFADSGFCVSAPGMEPLLLPGTPAYASERNVQIWRSKLDAAIADVEANQWFSKYMGFPCELAYMSDAHHRAVPNESAQFDDEVSFADAAPLLVISEGSLADLNARLEEPVTMTRFRPNLVVNATTPFAEDNWQRIRVGDAEFAVAWPCSRCMLPTVDPETAEKHPRGEPIETLKKFRRQGPSVMFGQNLIPRRLGRISVGDTVEIL
jgi:uncharacterized protein YcbX